MKKFSKILLLSVLSIFLVAGSAKALSITLDLATLDQFAQLNATSLTTTNVTLSTDYNTDFTDFDTTFPSVTGSVYADVGLIGTNLYDWSAYDTLEVLLTNTNESTWNFEFFIEDSDTDYVSSSAYDVLKDTSQILSVNLNSTDFDSNNIDSIYLRIIGDLPQDGDSDRHAEYDLRPVHEPATILLLGAGLIGLAGFSRKRFKK